MFTGIVAGKGRVLEATDTAVGRVFRIDAAAVGFDSVVEGESIAVNGACLTAVRPRGSEFELALSPETLRCTTLGTLQSQASVNLERALQVGDRLGGHFVTGHVDGVGEIALREDDEDFSLFRLDIPAPLRPMVASKGSITVEGVSLTVNTVNESGCTLQIIPHTLAVTTLGAITTGSRVNLEVDLLARYLAQLMKSQHES